ncbi:hypothetical protein J4217_04995 [Candidatus Pacearchaeota archaeon]|nr:hypothetical protein [Candidatus Pacearchaeota archaeon]
MELVNNKIISDKIINKLDMFVIKFVNILEKYTSYVIVSGYVSIVLGRSRATEDVDLLFPKINLSIFKLLFNELLEKGYECANTSNIQEALEMLNSHAIRFFEKGYPIPNIEFKQINNDIQRYSFENKISLSLKEKTLFISPLEVQIAYKLSLMSDEDIDEISSDKDFEDAKHIYLTFKEKLDIKKLIYFIKLLKVESKWELLKNG